MTEYGFTRVSTGSQDHATQTTTIHKVYPDAQIVSAGVASASKGQQLDTMDALISRLVSGDVVVVTESSRLDRREDLDAQAEVLLRIRQRGADVLSLSEPQFGTTDFAGRIVTLVAQQGNAQKSRTVKDQTWRGVQAIMANASHYGHLPMCWESSGERYGKQARCTDSATVTEIYEAVANGESLQSIARSHNVWPQQIKNLVKFEANHTGAIRCTYTYGGETFAWTHDVSAVVDSPLWWRANKVLSANATDSRANRGGRPVAQTVNWISGLLNCPACGGRLYVNAGRTPAGNARTPKLRCGGMAKTRKACGQFPGMDLAPALAWFDAQFSADDTQLLSYQRVSGNAHELDEIQAELARVQGQLSATEDDDELDALIDRRRALKASIAAFDVTPDTFAYAPTGRTVAQHWASSDDAKRQLIKAVRANALTMPFAESASLVTYDMSEDGIVDLGDGVCFRAA